MKNKMYRKSHTSSSACSAAGKAMYFSFFILHFSLFLLVSCKVERPKEVLPPSKMEEVLYDYHLAQVMGGDLTGENMYKRRLYIDYVYAKHHITEAQLDSSLVWYARNPKDLSAIYERMAARTERDMELIKQRQAKVSSRGSQPVEGDSADLWYDSRHFILTPTPLDNYRSVSIPYDNNFHPCDTIRWTFDVMFIGSQPTDRRLAVASLLIRYANDSVLGRDVVLRENAAVTITLQNADSVNVKNITAGVYFQGDSIHDHLVASHHRLMRFHTLAPKDTAEAVKADTLSVTSDRKRATDGRKAAKQKAAKKKSSKQKPAKQKASKQKPDKQKPDKEQPSKQPPRRDRVRMDAEE